MKKPKKIEIYATLDSFDLSDLNAKKVTEFISLLQSKLIQWEDIGCKEIEIVSDGHDCTSDNGCYCSGGSLAIGGKRLETDKEYETRIKYIEQQKKENEQYIKNQKQREYKMYKKLKKKFEKEDKKEIGE